MSQIQVFQCPSCGTSLGYSGGSEATITCQFCGSNVIVPAELRQPASAAEASTPAPDLSGLPSNLPLDKLAELKRLAQSGRKIEAIKLYREIFNVGLAEAKESVEKLEAGHPLVISSVSVESASPAGNAQAARVAEVLRLLRAGQKMEAIKLYRETFHVGLKDALNAVEAMEPSGRTTAASPARRAVKTAACTSTGCTILGGVGIIGFVLAMVFGAPFRMSGSYQQALEAARANPSVIDALGKPIEPSWLPIGGEISCGGSSCSANYSIPIYGPRKSGRIVVQSDSKGASLFNEGEWILNATVFVDGGGMFRLTGQSAGQPSAPTQVPQATRVPTPSRVPTPNTTATAKAEAAAQATETAANRATAQAILTAQAPWPVLIAEPFSDNHLGWPEGVKQDNAIAVTTVITNGTYHWTVKPKHSSSYWNMIPAGGKALTDFYATVNIEFISGGDYAYGLVFRSVDDDYGFFGIRPDGVYQMLVVYDTGIYQTVIQSAPAIRTTLGQSNQISVRAIGPDFVFLINDEVAGQLNEDFAPGAIGLGVDVMNKQDEAQVEFTDFEVRAP